RRPCNCARRAAATLLLRSALVVPIESGSGCDRQQRRAPPYTMWPWLGRSRLNDLRSRRGPFGKRVPKRNGDRSAAHMKFHVYDPNQGSINVIVDLWQGKLQLL